VSTRCAALPLAKWPVSKLRACCPETVTDPCQVDLYRRIYGQMRQRAVTPGPEARRPSPAGRCGATGAEFMPVMTPGRPARRPGLKNFRIVDAQTSMEHLIIDESVVAHRHAGRYLAVCGVQVLAASLTAPQQSRCPVCPRGVR
jgi:hypothetical protein